MSKRFKPIGSNSGTRVPVIFRDRPFEVPVTPAKKNYTKQDFLTRTGQWLEFKTLSGNHRGIIEDANSHSVLIKMPANSVHGEWADYRKTENPDFKLIGFDGYDGWKRGPWCWFWIPIVVVIIIFPWFCW